MNLTLEIPTELVGPLQEMISLYFKNYNGYYAETVRQLHKILTKIFKNTLKLFILVHFISYFTRRACEARVLKCCSNSVCYLKIQW